MDTCEICGLDFNTIAIGEIPGRISAGTSAIAAALLAAPEASRARPTPERWSALQYAAHVRDVLMMMRDRIVVGILEDEPSYTSLYREERVAMGLYRGDTVDAVTTELAAAAAMFNRLFVEVDPAELARTVQYGNPTSTERSLEWMAKQAVHETEHHLTDIEENLAG